MAVCDANYLRVRKLLPRLDPGTARRIGLPGSVSAVGAWVELQVLESFRYTSTLELRLFDTDFTHPYYRPPVMRIRLYHDANTAEVVSYQDRRTAGFQPRFAQSLEFTPDEKEQVNQFLAEWLTWCLDAGLGQSPASPLQAEEYLI